MRNCVLIKQQKTKTSSVSPLGLMSSLSCFFFNHVFNTKHEICPAEQTSNSIKAIVGHFINSCATITPVHILPGSSVLYCPALDETIDIFSPAETSITLSNTLTADLQANFSSPLKIVSLCSVTKVYGCFLPWVFFYYISYRILYTNVILAYFGLCSYQM